jgi:hypothetical protein
MKLTPIADIIPEKNIIVLSPHYDDVLFMLGGYILNLKKAGILGTKSFNIKLIFSRSNYQVGQGSANFDPTLERVQHATGIRLIEDQNCNNELLGDFGYSYELLGERECFVRGKSMTEGEMEFPQGRYEDFDAQDIEVFERMKQRFENYAMLADTALIVPMAIREHIDHFIAREAAISIAKRLGARAKARFYFQEDKPYGGLASEIELQRIEEFINSNRLRSKWYSYEPEAIIDLAFKHYVSQVDDVYKTGVRKRADFWKTKLRQPRGVDRICAFDIN